MSKVIPLGCNFLVHVKDRSLAVWISYSTLLNSVLMSSPTIDKYWLVPYCNTYACDHLMLIVHSECDCESGHHTSRDRQYDREPGHYTSSDRQCDGEPDHHTSHDRQCDGESGHYTSSDRQCDGEPGHHTSCNRLICCSLWRHYVSRGFGGCWFMVWLIQDFNNGPSPHLFKSLHLLVSPWDVH